jgi:hypothetical protein
VVEIDHALSLHVGLACENEDFDGLDGFKGERGKEEKR